MNTVSIRRVSLVVCLLVMVACGGKGGGDNTDGGMHGDGGVDGMMLPDNGPCTPGAQRCNLDVPETCDAGGSNWVPGTACTTFCQDGTCALPGLDVGSDMTLEGVVVVSGAVTVHSGATLSSATGNLTIEADSISVENGGSIAVTATGSNTPGSGSPPFDNEEEEPAGGGTNTGIQTDSSVIAGGPGGRDAFQNPGGPGGGTLRLFATTSISIAGTLTADGGNGTPATQNCYYGTGGGAGGGVLVVSDSVSVTGSISAAGGLGGPIGGTSCGTTATSASGNPGFVKLLYGSTNDLTTATITGTKITGIAPPIPLTSTSHPDPTAVYNDAFLSLDMAWTKSFPSAMGYYVLLNNTKSDPPTAATGTFLGTNKVSFPSTTVNDGLNYVHVVTEDGQSTVGSIESVFAVTINTQPPSMSSASHPTQTAFSTNTNPLFTWSYPQGQENVTAVYYVFDHFGDTVPTLTDTKLPATQVNLQQTNVAAGCWALHVVAADSQGRLTKVAGNYRVNIGADPGEGSVQGTIVDSTQAGVSGATVTLNNDLFGSITTAGGGTYSFGTTIPAGTWTLSATLGAKTGSKTVTVVAGQVTTGNLTIQ